MADFVKVAQVGDLPPGRAKVVQCNGEEVALFNVEGTFYALTNECAHQMGPLGEGELEGDVVVCPWHGWEFNVKTGVCQFDAAVQVKRFEVKVEGQNILVAPAQLTA